ncbi:hypothetical protein [Roseovarius sp. M141]|uniref:hypothetical protein n=1 Tax=Roseovarius sp. M141 TaxID=2583806 RepID=UPI0020CCEABE|nr:hypothetical protein [Roseovarius sp. M141]MCQ0091091.1 hypothetical protein [Roseovarius sp. M141]
MIPNRSIQQGVTGQPAISVHSVWAHELGNPEQGTVNTTSDRTLASRTNHAGDKESYIYSRLSDDIVLLTWVEADGLGATNTLRFSDMTILTNGNIEHNIFDNPGKLEHLPAP